MFVPYASVADAMLVVARNGDGDGVGDGEGRSRNGGGVTVLIVDTKADGITCKPLATVGRDHLESVTFEDVRLPVDRVLGEDEVPRGRSIVQAINLWGAAARCAEMVGGAEKVLEMTLDYAKERQQFGRPIGSFQAVQHRCANMAIDVLASRFITYEAIWTLDEGLDAAEIVSTAKAWTGDAYQRVCENGHQVHGAIGYTWEHDLHLYLRHATGSDLALGDADFHREQVIRQHVV
jgi:alkylation response protein AidB-like acyl-CoA dehydrogenase